MFPSFFRDLGMRMVGWRAFLPLFLAGLGVMRKRRFDIVYISTAHFQLFLLGPLWRLFARVPFVLDLHDPCYQKGITHPGGSSPSFRHLVAHWVAGLIEWLSAPRAAGIVSVSQRYIDMLNERFRGRKMLWRAKGRASVIPFAGSFRDLDSDTIRLADGQASRCEGNDRVGRIVYVGAGGPIMQRAFSVLCRTLAHLRTEGIAAADAIRIELYGTFLGWKEGGPKHLREVALTHGVGNFVREDPTRVSYARSLQLLREARGALVLGVEDAGYIPSKLFTYAASGKPLLAVLHRAGPAYALFHDHPELGHLLWFSENEEIDPGEAARIVREFLQEVTDGRRFDRRQTLQPFSEEAMARRHAELFTSICCDR